MNSTKTSTRRVLSVFSLVMINIIAIDSLRNLPADAAMGLGIGFYYLIAGIGFLLPCVLVTAELATHYPKAGGSYVWVREAFGAKWAFMNIWLQWIYNVFWYPTILSFIAANIAYLINPALVTNKSFMLPMIIGMFLVATLVNAFGMKLSSWVSSLSAVLGTLIPMVVIIALGIAWLVSGNPLAITPTLDHFIPLEWNGNVAFLVVVFFSLMGMEMSAVHAEEVKNPQRDYPRALLYSSVIILITMMLASAAIAMIVPQSSLNIISGLDQAFVKFLSAFGLQQWMPVVVILMVLGGFGGMAAWVIGPAKGLVVAANDGLAPAMFGKRNKYGVPIPVLLLQLAIVLLLCSLFLFFDYISTSYWILSVLTSQLALLFYVILFAAAIRLRSKTAPQAGAFRIPGGKLGIGLVGGLGLLSSLSALVIGFIPPNNLHITNLWRYELILVAGIIIFIAPPWLISLCRRRKL